MVSHPQSCCGCAGSEEVPGGLVAAGYDTAEVFEFAEETLGEVALAADGWIDRSLNLAVALGRDMGLSATPANQIDQVLPVIAAIGNTNGGV